MTVDLRELVLTMVLLAIGISVGVIVHRWLVRRSRLEVGAPQPWPNLNVRGFIVLVIVPTLAFVVLAMTLTMMKGLFDPIVDNSEIFKIIGPAFQMIVGAFGGFLGGYAMGKSATAAGDQDAGG